MQVWGNDSMDLFTQHHVCWDTADRYTFSHSQLNAPWPEWNELTKWALLGHLKKFVIRFRMQVLGSDSLVLFTQLHVSCETADRYTFPFSIECSLARMKWVDQMTFTWPFEKICYQIQDASVRQWFLEFVYTTSHVLWHNKSLYFFPISFECYLALMKFVDQMTSTWPFEKFSYQSQNASVSQWFHGFVYTTSHVLWHSKSQNCFPFSFECFLDRKKWVDQMQFTWSFE